MSRDVTGIDGVRNSGTIAVGTDGSVTDGTDLENNTGNSVVPGSKDPPFWWSQADRCSISWKSVGCVTIDLERFLDAEFAGRLFGSN